MNNLLIASLYFEDQIALNALRAIIRSTLVIRWIIDYYMTVLSVVQGQGFNEVFKRVYHCDFCCYLPNLFLSIDEICFLQPFFQLKCQLNHRIKYPSNNLDTNYWSYLIS